MSMNLSIPSFMAYSRLAACVAALAALPAVAAPTPTGVSLAAYHQAYAPLESVAIGEIRFNAAARQARIAISHVERCRFYQAGKELTADADGLTVTLHLADTEAISNERIDVAIGDARHYIELEFRSPAYFKSVGKPSRDTGFLTLSSDLREARHSREPILPSSIASRCSNCWG
jgi:hypothetical protein